VKRRENSECLRRPFINGSNEDTFVFFELKDGANFWIRVMWLFALLCITYGSPLVVEHHCLQKKERRTS